MIRDRWLVVAKCAVVVQHYATVERRETDVHIVIVVEEGVAAVVRFRRWRSVWIGGHRRRGRKEGCEDDWEEHFREGRAALSLNEGCQ
jgi:hypothetical protein